METLTRPRASRNANDAQTLLDALPVLVIGVDIAGRIHFANVAAAEMLAGAAGGLLGRRLGDVFGPDSIVATFGRRAAAEAIRLSQADIQLEGPNFIIGRADFIAAPVDEPPGAALTFIPRAFPRATAIERTAPPIARTLAHEVRNPLAGIRAAAQLIGKDANAETRVLTDMICAEADRIRRLTDRIDALDEIAAPRVSPVNIHEVLGRAQTVVATTFPNIAIDELYDPSLPPVSGDMDQLIQLFLNITKNAAEAVRGRPNGRVTLSTRYRPGVRVRSAGGVSRPQMEIAVSDNGPGIAADMMDGRVFEPFATTKQDGVGLGLAIAAEIVARHEGRIDVESRPGHTVFRVLLPIAEELEP
jgi:two-component system, NtrC family, nitrogen regulation sensor histidine kinase GlnL